MAEDISVLLETGMKRYRIIEIKGAKSPRYLTFYFIVIHFIVYSLYEFILDQNSRSTQLTDTAVARTLLLTWLKRGILS